MTLVLQIAVVLVGAALAVWAGTRPVRALLERIDGPQGEDAKTVPGLLNAEKDLPGGFWIGLLERAAVYLCIVSGMASGIAIVVAIKALGRYPELRTSDVRKGELFIIGTLASLLWASLCGWLAWLGVGLLVS
ncbi:hypothetical protein [Tessaracoccus caeni]|uniref:hypothetical protein n=1 Tax=Tessaracoccus caeni TaxID=3031239 RepID=UPI0023DBF09B|nr:hypothetical protein [Tessaracoccus caeni]MDF1490231.1 hypothetical protein [Tessaracoccus caeni]